MNNYNTFLKNNIESDIESQMINEIKLNKELSNCICILYIIIIIISYYLYKCYN